MTTYSQSINHNVGVQNNTWDLQVGTGYREGAVVKTSWAIRNAGGNTHDMVSVEKISYVFP